ncbi:hypothetical protein [Streptacidiphilus rugosus]|uniref:hypothetical protein n=1 Tax=Streptacidiphilus rugosus TaxID=405783 RepID=UPI000B1E9221|nr:hypothetical protein [Streptacidiphilus rugosus]
MSDEPLPTEPAPLLQLLQLPGLPAAPTGDAPVCGPEGCAVPQSGTGATTETDQER